jgi:hypothetical protein
VSVSLPDLRSTRLNFGSMTLHHMNTVYTFNDYQVCESVSVTLTVTSSTPECPFRIVSMHSYLEISVSNLCLEAY